MTSGVLSITLCHHVSTIQSPGSSHPDLTHALHTITLAEEVHREETIAFQLFRTELSLSIKIEE